MLKTQYTDEKCDAMHLLTSSIIIMKASTWTWRSCSNNSPNNSTTIEDPQTIHTVEIWDGEKGSFW